MPWIEKGLLVALVLGACASAAKAQTKPAVTSLGPDYPKTEMFTATASSIQ